MMIKSRQLSLWGFVLLTVPIIAVCLHDVLFFKSSIMQDTRSGSVVLRQNRFLLPRRTIFLYRTKNYVEKQAIWRRGAAIAFEPPLEVGQVAAIESAMGNRYLIQLAELDSSARKATFRILSPEAHIRHQAELLEDQEIPIADDVHVPWSFHTSSSVYLYADKFFRKPERELYRVSILSNANLNTDVQALPQADFRAIPEWSGN